MKTIFIYLFKERICDVGTQVKRVWHDLGLEMPPCKTNISVELIVLACLHHLNHAHRPEAICLTCRPLMVMGITSKVYVVDAMMYHTNLPTGTNTWQSTVGRWSVFSTQLMVTVSAKEVILPFPGVARVQCLNSVGVQRFGLLSPIQESFESSHIHKASHFQPKYCDGISGQLLSLPILFLPSHRH